MKTALAATATLLLAACASQQHASLPTAAEQCARLAQAIPAFAIALPTRGVRIDAAPQLAQKWLPGGFSVPHAVQNTCVALRS